MTPTTGQQPNFLQKLISLAQGTLPNPPSAGQQFQNMMSGENFAAPTSNGQGNSFMQNLWGRLTGNTPSSNSTSYLQPIVDSYMKQKQLQQMKRNKVGKKKQSILTGDDD